jgi:capsular polysaccharide biosynthesis protein
VFVACFENAVAHSRSGAIQLGSQLCFDIQSEELDSMPVDMAFDPLVFSRDGREVAAIIDQRATTTIKLDHAWSLLGLNTVSFGHWMIEGLLQFLGARRMLNLEGVPLLIDEQMPPQHRESLELLGRGRFPIVVVPRWSRVEAGRLWRATNWFYSPHLLLTDQGLDPRHFVMPMREVAQLYQFGAGLLDEVLATAGQDKQVFIARPNTLHRRITNFGEIGGFLETRGFSVFFPEQHPFGEQVRTVREARNIVIQNGSGAHALLLARPKTKACYLTHPGFPIVSLLAELLKAVDVEMKIVSGPFEKKTEPYVDQSDYRIPLDQLRSALDSWMGCVQLDRSSPEV